jgi:predicted nucleotidyltransferase
VAVVLYGSVARGAAAPGDLDLLVIVAKENEEEHVRSALLDATRRLEVRFQLAVSPLVLTERELKARANEKLIANVLKEGIFLTGEPVGPLRRMRRWHRVPVAETG